MDRAAVVHARNRLVNAEKSLKKLKNANARSEANRRWSDFLIACAGVYNKLEQGAKSSGSSEAWFGRKKHERKSDGLLSYLHHARNAEEHSLQQITGESTGAFFVHGSMFVTPLGDGQFKFDRTNKPGSFTMVKSRLTLLPVKDERFGDTFPPPTDHLKQPVTSDDALEIGGLALAYLRKMIDEAYRLTV